MQPPGRFTHFARRRSRQRGQTYAEYLVVTTALIGILLIASGDTAAPFVALVSGLKSFFGAYSFALSLP
ncbi:conserved hypothetical protein [Paraburkholderia ribeironis]|uniref:Uncharacterized protein n=1 Tax=Paraburkholderia ribeironis TaxID=1247936 RepID=A0A1N7SEJ7_9BURK|nr:hypothetical protein [Paraburkholderia ribeironis]SIT45762.1 conserved hypothetical protein [Paraburkholderia ribeironis]